MHTWKFFRTGGLDQVTLESGADLLNLGQLDQKLWVALSCPVKGLELDEATLKLIDTDGDGRIRVPELLAAIKWAAPYLKDAGVLLQGADGMPLSAINDATPEGQIVLASAKQILANVGRKDATVITVVDTGNTTQIFSASPLNGDGIILPAATDDPDAQALIKDIIDCLGGAKDRTGQLGITGAHVDQFYAELNAYVYWTSQSGGKDIAVLGDATDAAVVAVRAVRAKVDDYFTRCRLAAFDARATAALNRSESDYLAVAAKDLTITADEVAAFPLARITGMQPLPLFEGVNPAWAAALSLLYQAAVIPLLGADRPALTEAEWRDINARLSPYETWLGSKAGSHVEKLGLKRIKAILNGHGFAMLTTLIARDKTLEPYFKAVSDVDRLVHYHRDLRALLHNFVNFADFYSRDRWAVFQSGTLYLDSRSTELCVRVEGPNPLAAMSRAYIAYCACTRPGGQTMNIAACFTQGDSDYLFVGRHGLFYDRAGRDWDAVITSIVDNPINLRQAFWSPYKKFVRMIEEMVAKRAAAAEAASHAKMAGAAEGAANAGAAPIEPPKKVDVGAVAAIGVAISGAITALTLILGYVFQLRAWQYPLVLVGIIIVISAPSVVIAWIKLRQRTLGPILEGNGWAVNGRVRINIPFGTKLTDLAELPPGAIRALEDPYEDKQAVARRRLVILGLVLLIALAGWIRWDATQHRGPDGLPRYFWQERPVVAMPLAPAAPTMPAPTSSHPTTTPDPAAERARIDALQARTKVLRQQMEQITKEVTQQREQTRDADLLALRRQKGLDDAAALDALQARLAQQLTEIRAEIFSLQQRKADISSHRTATDDPVTEDAKINALEARIKVLLQQMEQVRTEAIDHDQREARFVESRRRMELEELNRRIYPMALELSRIREALGGRHVSNINNAQIRAEAQER